MGLRLLPGWWALSPLTHQTGNLHSHIWALAKHMSRTSSPKRLELRVRLGGCPVNSAGDNSSKHVGRLCGEEAPSWAFRMSRIQRGGERKKDIPGQGQGNPKQRPGGGTWKVSRPAWLPGQLGQTGREQVAHSPGLYVLICLPSWSPQHFTRVLGTHFPVYGLHPLSNEGLE